MGTDCPAVLELVRDGSTTGMTPCRLNAGHEGEHFAQWKESARDEREVAFYDPERMAYDVRAKGFIVKHPAPKASSTPAAAPKASKAAKTNGVHASAPAAAPLQITSIPLDALVESPFNKRRTWGDLKELAASMGNGVGILEPLLARQMGDGRYELIFGHRRLRAAKIAGLTTAPVMVRELADDVALEMQAIENLQRADLHPLEEAEGYEQLMSLLHWSADDVAAKIGKSRAYVYGRLKLCELVPKARKIFADGKMSCSVAQIVARVPSVLQEKCLEELAEEGSNAGLYDEDEALQMLPFREAQGIIQDRYMLRLDGAPFDRGDATLLPKAGACKDCPKRTGNQRELFADVKSADVCTDPVCFGEKRAAHNGRVAEKLGAKGIVVVQPKRDQWGNIRPPSGYAKLDEFCSDAGKRYEEVLEKARKKAPRTPVLKDLQQKVVMLDDKGKAVEVVKTKGLLAAAGIKSRESRMPGSTFDHKAHQEKRALEEKLDGAVMGALVKVVEETGLTEEILQIATADLARSFGYMVEERRGLKRGSLEKAVAQARGGELAGYLIELVFGESDRKAREQACKKLGVNVAAITKRVTDEAKAAKRAAEDAKASAKPAGKPAKKGGKKS